MPSPSRLVFLVGLTVLLSFSLAAPSAFAQQVEGVWLTQDGDAKIEIQTCGDTYCGKIVWLKEPLEEDGSPKLDDENPDPKLRTQPIMGLELLHGFDLKPNKKGLYTGGKIYDAGEGKTYSCQMSFKDKDQLKIRGYLGISLLGRNTIWTRSSL